MFDFLSIKKTVEAMRKQYGDMLSEVRELEAKIVAIRHAPLSKDALRAMIEEWVQARVSGFGTSFAKYIGESAKFKDGSYVPNMDEGLLNMLQGSGHVASVTAVDSVLLGVFGVQIKKAMMAAIDEMDWPANGLGKSEREVEIARLQTRVNELRASITTLMKEADEAGVDL